jgi:hypothetical protein
MVEHLLAADHLWHRDVCKLVWYGGTKLRVVPAGGARGV